LLPEAGLSPLPTVEPLGLLSGEHSLTAQRIFVWFQYKYVAMSQEYKDSGKNRFVAAALSWFLGGFGVHKLYIGQKRTGIKYLLFFWTFIPAFFGFAHAVHYLIMGEEEFHRRITMDEGKFETWKESKQEEAKERVEEAKQEAEESQGIDVPDDAVMFVEGASGHVILFNNKIRILREDISLVQKLNHLTAGEKEIPLDNITSIQFREPGMATKGYIQFGQSGYDESDDGVFDAADDENSVMFVQDQTEDFRQLRSKIEELKNESIEKDTKSMDDAMQTLRQKYAEGDITEEEYEERKEVLQEA
jgi:TM2 domain-containing membrane protein YozV